MADYAPPPGPPPPKVPEGWTARWNDQYKEWFYVNQYTKKSQWDKPTEPVYGEDGGSPLGPPPGYGSSSPRMTGPEKGGYGQDNNPYHQPGQGSMSDDEKLARQLQAEEEARASGRPTSRGANDDFYSGGQQASPYGQSQSPYGQQQQSTYGQQQQSPYGSGQLPAREEKSKGLLGKLAGKFGGSSSSRPQQYGQQGYPPQQYGGYQGGYPPQQPYGYGQGYPGQQPAYYGQQQQQRKQGGLGAGGGALLGAGAGLVGGALLMDAVEDHDQSEYQQGYDQGQDNGGGDGGGDYGGGDGGGDYGGGDDGGDMGGGDF